MMRQPSMAIEKSFVTVRFGRFNGLTGCCSLLTTKFEPICQHLIMSRGKDVLLTIKILHARVHPSEWKNINNCKYILADDRCGYFVTVKPLQATCRCLLLFVPRGWWSLFISYLQLLSFIWLQYETRNTSCYGYWYRAFLAHKWPVHPILNMTLLASAVVDCSCVP